MEFPAGGLDGLGESKFLLPFSSHLVVSASATAPTLCRQEPSGNGSFRFGKRRVFPDRLRTPPNLTLSVQEALLVRTRYLVPLTVLFAFVLQLPGCADGVAPPVQLRMESEHFLFVSTTDRASRAEVAEGLARAEVLFFEISGFVGVDNEVDRGNFLPS